MLFLLKMPLPITVLFIYLLSLLIISKNNLTYNLEGLKVIKKKDINKGRIRISNANISKDEIGPK